MKTLMILSLAFSLSVGCSDDGTEPFPTDGTATIFAVGTDYFSSSLASRISLPSLTVEQNSIAGVASTDPVVRLHGNNIYIINRFGFDNVTVIDSTTMTLVGQYSTGAGSNPQDVAVDGTQLYVATAAGPGLVVIDTTDSSVETIDLSSLDEDGIPNCHAVEIMADTLYVACRVLDDNDDELAPRGASKVALVDLADSPAVLVDHTVMPFPISTGRFVESADGDLLIAGFVDYIDYTQGCIANGSYEGGDGTAPCLVDNSDLGGYAASMVVIAGDLVAAVVSGFDSNDFGAIGSLQSIAYSPGSVTTSALTAAPIRAFDVASCATGELVLADAAGGLRILASDGSELSSTPLDIGAPPVGGGVVCY